MDDCRSSYEQWRCNWEKRVGPINNEDVQTVYWAYRDSWEACKKYMMEKPESTRDQIRAALTRSDTELDEIIDVVAAATGLMNRLYEAGPAVPNDKAVRDRDTNWLFILRKTLEGLFGDSPPEVNEDTIYGRYKTVESHRPS